jgi:hypothetical protein
VWGVWGVWGVEVWALWGCGVTPYVRHSTDCTCCDFGHLRFYFLFKILDLKVQFEIALRLEFRPTQQKLMRYLKKANLGILERF